MRRIEKHTMFKEIQEGTTIKTGPSTGNNPDVTRAAADQLTLDTLCAMVNRFKAYIGAVDAETFCIESAEHSSVGKHVRHVIDRSRCLLDGTGNGLIDYDDRERCTDLEHNPALCVLALERIEQEIHALPRGYQDYPLLITETVSENGCKPTVHSTLGRELLDIVNHSIHHLAIIKLILNSRGITTTVDMGKTPSTILFERRHKPV